MADSLKNPSCFLYGPGVAKFEESPYPKIEDQCDVVLRIEYVGVCGSDVNSSAFPIPSQTLTFDQVHFWNHGGIVNMVDESHPLIMGHEDHSSFSLLATFVSRHLIFP